MTERRFFQLAASLPIILPIIGGLIAAPAVRAERTDVSFPVQIGVFLVFTSFYSTIPYAALVALLYWRRGIVARFGYRRTVCVAPLAIAVAFAPIFALTDGPGGGAAAFGLDALIGGAFTLGVGYAYAAIILCSYLLARQLGCLIPDGHELRP